MKVEITLLLIASLLAFSVLRPPLSAQSAKAFDVASMKPSDPKLDRTVPLRMDTLRGGRFIARNTALKFLIAFAYGVKDQNLSGTPVWFENKYDIDALANGAGEMTGAELRPLLISLLGERMKLAAHKEGRQVTIYTLTIAAGGVRMKPSGSDAAPTFGFTQPTHMFLKNATMQYVAGTLSRHPDIHTEVIDKTGLPGQFDLEMDWRSAIAQGNAPSGTDLPDSIFTTVREQLGLKLTPEKGTEEFLVIDHAEKPSAN